jgi:type IV pilus assembly protein PilB
MAAGGRRRRLGDLLIEAGLLDAQKLQAALNEQRKWGGRLGRTVIDMGFVTETAMSEVLAHQLSLPVIDLDTAPLDSSVTANLRLDLCERYGVFPLEKDAQARTLRLATSDPTNFEALQAIEFATNLKVLPVVATASSIERAVRRHYFGEDVKQPAATIRPEAMVTNETTYELDALLGAVPQPSAPPRPAPLPGRPPPPAGADTTAEAALRREVNVLREKVDALEEQSASQVRALRVLLELLIEAGLVTRDEYLERLHAPE